MLFDPTPEKKSSNFTAHLGQSVHSKPVGRAEERDVHASSLFGDIDRAMAEGLTLFPLSGSRIREFSSLGIS